MNLPRYLVAAAMFSIAALRSLSAGTPDASTAVKEVAAHFQDAWNRHDIEALGALMADNVVFINVAGKRLNGRKEFKDHHADLHKVVMAHSVLSTKSVEMEFVTPDKATVHWEWALQADQNRDGTARPPREGVFSWVLERHGATWLVVESQNVNKIPPAK